MARLEGKSGSRVLDAIANKPFCSMGWAWGTILACAGRYTKKLISDPSEHEIEERSRCIHRWSRVEEGFKGVKGNLLEPDLLAVWFLWALCVIMVMAPGKHLGSGSVGQVGQRALFGSDR